MNNENIPIRLVKDEFIDSLVSLFLTANYFLVFMKGS